MRCLLVDDNEAFVEIARRVLDPNGVKIAGTASNIAEAVLRVGELRPDIILVDVMLGDENGFDLARRLAGFHARDLAVIMISSAAEDDYTDLMSESDVATSPPLLRAGPRYPRQSAGTARPRSRTS